MYSVATFQMAKSMNLDLLNGLPPIFPAIALAAWLATFIGLLRNLARKLRPRPREPLAAGQPSSPL